MTIGFRLGVSTMMCAVALAQQGKPGARPKKTVTATGCIELGVECNVLKNQAGKPDHSVPRTEKLKVGRGYRITGVVHEIGICQEGKPILEQDAEEELVCAPGRVAKNIKNAKQSQKVL